MMLIILRGRLKEAQYGDRFPGAPGVINRRPDLDEIEVDIGNIQAQHSHALADHLHHSRTDPGLAAGRLEYFSDLNPKPQIFEATVDHRFDNAVPEYFTARRILRDAAKGTSLERGEEAILSESVTSLKAPACECSVHTHGGCPRGSGDSIGVSATWNASDPSPLPRRFQSSEGHVAVN
jgi:hypothetical protein